MWKRFQKKKRRGRPRTAGGPFAALVDGKRPLARAPEPGFVETPFSDIIARLPERLEATG